MNYRAELKGFCVDRVIRMWEVDGASHTPRNISALTEAAEKLADYCYVPNKDLHDTAGYLFELMRSAEAGEAHIDEVMAQLEQIKVERMRQGLDKKEEETVQ